MKKIIVFISIFALLLIVSCNDSNNSNVKERLEVASDSVTDVHFDYDMSSSLDGLTEKSTHIFIGEIVEVIDTVNLSRDYNDHSLPSEEQVYEGERIKFNITRVLKGELTDKEISIVSLKSFQNLVSDDKQKHNIPYYNEPIFEQLIIVFLNFNPQLGEFFPLEIKQFEPASSPYLFSFESDKAIKMLEKDEEVKALFKDAEFDFDKLQKIIEESN